MASIQLNGTSFEWREKGSGPPVLFVHGSACDFRTWNNQIAPFSERYHTLVYSRRYHYPNTWKGDGSDYTVTLHAQDLEAFLKSFDTGPVNLVGSSYGAYIALLTALKNPDLVKSLVLGEPPVLPLLLSDSDNPLEVLKLLMTDFKTGKSFIRFGMKSMKPAQQAFRKGNVEEGVRLFTSGVLGEGGFEQMPAEEKATVMDNAPALQAELLGPGFPPFPKESIMKLIIPTLLVYGEGSPRFFHAISDKLSALLPVSEKVVIPDASHEIHGDNPHAYNEAVLEFLSRHN
jgi:pimeloyl-ACP methyl ester carboxylesterase